MAGSVAAQRLERGELAVTSLAFKDRNPGALFRVGLHAVRQKHQTFCHVVEGLVFHSCIFKTSLHYNFSEVLANLFVDVNCMDRGGRLWVFIDVGVWVLECFI